MVDTIHNSSNRALVAGNSSVAIRNERGMSGAMEGSDVAVRSDIKNDMQTADHIGQLGGVTSAVSALNDYIQSVQRDLHFSIDEELGETVVRVVDRHSGEMIRQIPNETVLEIAKRLKTAGDINLLTAQG